MLSKSLGQWPTNQTAKVKSTNGALYNSLGQRPRNQRKGKNGALKGRPQPETGVHRERVYFGKFVGEGDLSDEGFRLGF